MSYLPKEIIIDLGKCNQVRPGPAFFNPKVQSTKERMVKGPFSSLRLTNVNAQSTAPAGSFIQWEGEITEILFCLPLK